MLARRLRGLLAGELFAYCLVLHAALRGATSWTSAIACVVVTHLALRCAAVPLGALVAAPAARASGVPRLGPARALSLLRRECQALWWNYVLAPFDPWLRTDGLVQPGRSTRGATAPAPEIVLVHGILCNRVVWRAFQAALGHRGYASRAVNLSPVLGSLDTMAADLVAQLHDTRAPLVLVGHSMGGLVIRRALQLRSLPALAAIVTIGTPHRGSVQARLAPGQAARSMRRGSRWLAELDAGEAPRPTVRRLSIRSLHDELVSPPDSARWRGAAELVLQDVGHVALLADDRVIEAVAAEIDASLRATSHAADGDTHDAGEVARALP